MKGVGDRKAGIELEEVNINEHVYEDLNKKQVNINVYENVQRRGKTKLNDTSQLKMDTIKVVVALLCVGMAVLVAADVTVVCLVIFGVTDGGWTHWESWGACSVTCGTGFTTRTRTCSNPQPSIMGRYCDGTSVQVQSCNNTSCSATDCGWANWENWEACSVTCGTGLTTRIRTYSNSRPSIMGRYCDGTSLQVQSCNNTSCSVTDGGWANWEAWGACSVTCGTGFTTRIRTCSNPRPSIMGRYCDGTSLQVQSCNNTSCSVTDGSWTNWENWEACSVTCGTGFTTRIRTCSSPRPSIMGRYCDGTSMQVLTCNITSCSDLAIGFSMYTPDTSSSGDSLIFQKAVYNDGNVFNMTSGMFVCKKEGLYFFINTMIRLSSKTSRVTCYFYRNGIQSPYVAGYADDVLKGNFPSGTNSIMFHLKPGDRVYLGSCNGTSNMAGASSFTGFLVSPMV